MSTRPDGSKDGHDCDHHDRRSAYHELPGEHERVAFHSHQFEHECYGHHCAESDRLYAEWQSALARARRPD
jgi:hypothetical protein